MGDFNGDGNQDLALNNGSLVSILLGDGAGNFGAATNVFAGNNTRAVAVGDFNGDGKQDLAVTTTPDGGYSTDVSILLGDGGGNFSSPTDFVVTSGNRWSWFLTDRHCRSRL